MRTLLLFAMLCVASDGFSAELHGKVGKVVDGDTFWLCDLTACHKIRVCGIDTPEKGDAMFRTAKVALQVIIESEAVRCVPVGQGTPCDRRSKPTSKDRIVAQCFVGSTDIAAPLVNSGFACDWVKFSGGYYSKRNPARVCHARMAR